MIAAEIVTCAAVGHGAHENRLPRTIVIHRMILRGRAFAIALRQLGQVEHGGREVANLLAALSGYVTSHRESLEIHFRSRHRGTYIEIHAPFELLYGPREEQEIGVAG